jgi:small subunit ribosomal protein S4
VNIPSYRLKVGDEISVGLHGQKMLIIKENLKEYSKSGISPWLSLNADTMKGTFLAVPRRSDVTEVADIKEQLVVELYSR